MFLNKSDLEKIRKYFQRTGVKDSDMPLTNAVNDSDCIVIVSNGQNKRITVELLKSHMEESPIPSPVPSQQLPGNIIVQEDGFYQIKGNSVYPLAHPDLSTQPSVLPERFGTYPIYEKLVPLVYNNTDDLTIPDDALPEDSYIMQANIFTKNISLPICLFHNKEGNVPSNSGYSWIVDNKILETVPFPNTFSTYQWYLYVKYALLEQQGSDSAYNQYTQDETLIINLGEAPYNLGLNILTESSTGCGIILGALSNMYPTYSDRERLNGAILKDIYGHEAQIVSVAATSQQSNTIDSIVYTIGGVRYEMSPQSGVQRLN